MKVCSRCAVEKSLDDFRAKRAARDGRRSECRACQDAYNGAYFTATRTQKAAYDRERYLARRDEVLAARRAHRELNAEAIRIAQREYRKANPDRLREWRQANLERTRGYVRKRRALMKGVASEPYSTQDVWNKTGGRCGICELPVLGSQRAEIDHILPISRGGSDTLANVQIAHMLCNRTKWAHEMG